MIQITQKYECCGCEACVQTCPLKCIVMTEDYEGFLYPDVNIEICSDCGLCEKVCPVMHQAEPREPLLIFAAKSRDEKVRSQSSSGGIFTLLAEQTIKDGGVVFGAKFDSDWNVIHDYTETIEGLAAFRGSKYVQSRIGDSFTQAEMILKKNRKVLFSGTPCQIAGLKLFLRKEYDNLLMVDFICHGVPSPMVWRRYNSEILATTGPNTISQQVEAKFFTSINFRDKTEGWKKFSFAATVRAADKNSVSLRSTLHDNIYMRGFLRDLYLRPSCHACPAKRLKSGSDITLADFWGIQRILPWFDDDRGASLVSINTLKGKGKYHATTAESQPVGKEALQSIFFQSAKNHPNREQFFQRINGVLSLTQLIEELTFVPLLQRLKKYIGAKFKWTLLKLKRLTIHE